MRGHRSERGDVFGSLLAVALLASCGASALREPPKPAPAPERTRRDAAESLERLEAAILELESAPGPLVGRPLGAVVQALARAMEPLSHAGRLRLDALASRMAGAPVRSLPQAGLLKEALQMLLDTLVRVRPTPALEGDYQAALRRVADERDHLDELLLLDDQRLRLAAALRAAGNATFLARGAEPPFREDAPSSPARVVTGPFREQLARARRDVAAVARISLMGSRLASARALASMADMVAAADEQGLLTRQIDELRFQATRLERASDSASGRAGWIRAGLQAAVDALSVANGGERSPWIDEAARAVAGIDAESAPSFQRAAIQDALRATVDAFAALEPSQGEPSP